MPPYPADGLNDPVKKRDCGGDGDERQHTVFNLKDSPCPPLIPFSTAVSSVVELSSAALTSALSRGIPAVRDLLLGGATTESLGSNNWVVDGTLSETGKPLLANDPHLGTNVPSTWYLAHLSARR